MTNQDKDYKKTQKELTELNSDGNEGIGEEGETIETPEEATLRKRIEELRKRDPFIYR